ncbi:MAG: methyltransferase domain-containing protein [Kiritimatiellales bacterium]|nr:methyltransferase domain-containing protein [Kiritimatiellales bacterium]
MSTDQEFWGGSDIVYYCLVDKKRTNAYKRAITNAVNKGDIVADLGSGTGIFAHFALMAGAKKVYAVEADKNLFNTLKKSLKNRYGDRVEVINGDASKVKFPEKLDVVICEMIATGLIDEYQVPVMNNINKYLKNSSIIIPERIKNFADLVYNNDKFYGLRLPIVRYEYFEQIDKEATNTDSFSKKQMYSEIDFRERNKLSISANLNIKILKNGIINGIRISNETYFHNNSKLGGTLAYCMPLILPIEQTIVKKGDKLNLNLKYRICEGLENMQYTLINHQ